MKGLFFLLAILLLLNSCATFQEPEFLGLTNYKLGQISGRELKFHIEAKVSNPNWYTIKIKPSDLEVYVEDQLMGTVRLDKTLKIKGKSESDLIIDLNGLLADGAMITAVRYMNKEEVRVNIKGKVKGGVFIFSKKFEVDETRSVNGRNLRFGQ